MINLLPDATKKEIRSARVSVILARYIIVALLASGFLALLLAGSYFALAQTQSSAQQIIDTDETKAEVYNSTKAEVSQLSANLAETKNILDQEVRYSKVLVNIGQQMPAGTVLEDIALDANSFTGAPLSLKAYAKTNAAAVALRENIQSSPIFTNVNFESIDSISGGIEGYPVSVSMTVSITKAATL